MAKEIRFERIPGIRGRVPIVDEEHDIDAIFELLSAEGAKELAKNYGYPGKVCVTKKKIVKSTRECRIRRQDAKKIAKRTCRGALTWESVQTYLRGYSEQ